LGTVNLAAHLQPQDSSSGFPSLSWQFLPSVGPGCPGHFSTTREFASPLQSRRAAPASHPACLHFTAADWKPEFPTEKPSPARPVTCGGRWCWGWSRVSCCGARSTLAASGPSGHPRRAAADPQDQHPGGAGEGTACQGHCSWDAGHQADSGRCGRRHVQPSWRPAPPAVPMPGVPTSGRPLKGRVNRVGDVGCGSKDLRDTWRPGQGGSRDRLVGQEGAAEHPLEHRGEDARLLPDKAGDALESKGSERGEPAEAEQGIGVAGATADAGTLRCGSPGRQIQAGDTRGDSADWMPSATDPRCGTAGRARATVKGHKNAGGSGRKEPDHHGRGRAVMGMREMLPPWRWPSGRKKPADRK